MGKRLLILVHRCIANEVTDCGNWELLKIVICYVYKQTQQTEQIFNKLNVLNVITLEGKP